MLAVVVGLLLALALAALVPPGAEAKRVRVFAAGPKLDVERWLDTREHFHDKWFALIDRELRDEPGAPLIQNGADDVASHLLGPSDPSRPAKTARDLVTLPEDAGFWALLVGSRGAQSRAQSSAVGAVATLGTTYAPQVSYYQAQFPGLAGRLGRALVVALTDTFARVTVETFAELADRYDVYLEAGVNMAHDWQVVCEDREEFNSASPPRLPGAVKCAEESPMKVAALRDPDEPDRDYAYEATTAAAVNMGLIFDPDGRLISKQVKTYLTPLELGPVGLDLKPGDVSGLGAVRTPVGTLGVVTSKDAWMPDVQAKLDQYGVEVLIQPEYFVGDTVRPGGPWSPDTLHASGYNDVLRRPSFEAMVLPELTGNAFDLAADAQSHIVVRPRSKSKPAGPALVGQPEQRGFEEVARWVVPDPASPGEPFAERRQRLGEGGEKTLPGSGVGCPDPAEAGPCENGQVEDVIFTDIEVKGKSSRHRYRAPRSDGPFSRNRPLTRGKREQRNVDLAGQGKRVFAAFEERRRGRSRVAVALSIDGGRTFKRLASPAGGRGSGAGARARARNAEQWNPSVAISSRCVFAAWTEARSGKQRVRVAVSNDGRRFGKPVTIPPASDSDSPHTQWLPELAPASAPGGDVHLAYLEEDDLSADDGLPQTRVVYRSVDGTEKTRCATAGAKPGPPQRLDQGQPSEFAAKMDHSWAPDIASRGKRVVVSWVDFRTYDWRAYARTSTDGGASFAPEQELGEGQEPGEPEILEQLADSPSVALGPEKAFVAWTEWRKEGDTNVRPGSAYDTWIVTAEDGAFGLEVRADDLGAEQASTFWPAAAADGSDALVAYQDSSAGLGDIRIARIRGGSERDASQRVDDTGDGAVNQYRPAIATSGRNVIVAWEDERNGPSRIFFARARSSRVGA